MQVSDSKFQVVPTTLQDLVLLKRRPIGDSRGYLERMFCTSDLKALLAGRRIEQINHTLTEKAGTIRGLHYQAPPFAEMKFVSCVKGRVLDVAVDLRVGSPTYLKHYSTELSEFNHLTLCIPEGFAHGFQTLTNHCEMLYFHTAPYSASHEAGLNTLDPTIAIAWPLPVGERSTRDQQFSNINSEFIGVRL